MSSRMNGNSLGGSGSRSDDNGSLGGKGEQQQPGLKKRVVDILSSFIKGRPSAEQLREKNIIESNTVSPRIHGYDDPSPLKPSTSTPNFNAGRGNGDAKTYGGSPSNNNNNSGSMNNGGIKSAWERIRNLDFTFSKFTFGKTVVHRLPFPQFGLSPTELQSLYPDQQDGIPLVLTKCFEFLKKGHLETEGLFRVPGSKRDISLLKFRVEDGDLNFDDVLNPYTICGLISTFLKEMPEPLIPLDQYQYAVSCAQQHDDEKKLSMLKILVLDLPPANLCLIKKFLEFVLLIEGKKEFNKMNSDNLGIIFGPTLMKDPDFEDISKSFVNLKHQSQLVKSLIDNFDKIFDSKQVNKAYRQSMKPDIQVIQMMDTSSIDYLDPALEDTPKRLSNMSSIGGGGGSSAGQYSTLPASSFGGLDISSRPKPTVPPRPTRNSHRRETMMLSPRTSSGMDSRTSQIYAITTLTRPQSKQLLLDLSASNNNNNLIDFSPKPPRPPIPVRKINTVIPTTTSSTANTTTTTTTTTTIPPKPTNTVPSKLPPLKPVVKKQPPLKPAPTTNTSVTATTTTTTTTTATTTTTTTNSTSPGLKPIVPTTAPHKPLPNKINNLTKAPPTVTNANLLQQQSKNNATTPVVAPTSKPSPTTMKAKPEPPKRTFTNCTVIDAEGYAGEAKQTTLDSPSLKPLTIKPSVLKQISTPLVPSSALTTATTTTTEKAPDSPVLIQRKKVTINPEPINLNPPTPPSTTTVVTPGIITKPFPSKSSPPVLIPKTNSFSNIKDIHEKKPLSNVSTMPVSSSPPMVPTPTSYNTLNPTQTSTISDKPTTITTTTTTTTPTPPPPLTGKSKSFLSLKPSANSAPTSPPIVPTSNINVTPGLTTTTTTPTTSPTVDPLLHNRKYLNPNNKSKSASNISISTPSYTTATTTNSNFEKKTITENNSITPTTIPIINNITTSILKKSPTNPPFKVVQFQSPDVQKK